MFGSSGVVIGAVCVNWGGYRNGLGQFGAVIETVGSRRCLCQLGWL